MASMVSTTAGPRWSRQSPGAALPPPSPGFFPFRAVMRPPRS